MTEDGLREHYYSVPTTTDGDGEITDYTFEQFRHALTKSIMKDTVLTNIITQQILDSYSHDLVQTFCTIVEKNFDKDLDQCQKAITFVSRWLSLVDERDQQSLDEFPNRHVWLIGHVYASFEYDQNDLLSFYSACRIADRLYPTKSFYDELFRDQYVTRSSVRETLFRRMFDGLWAQLCELSTNGEDSDTWTLSYTLISKYYPSDKVLERTELFGIKHQIEFMNLANLIFLNETTPEPIRLVRHLLNHLELLDGNNPAAFNYAKMFPSIITLIHQYFQAKQISDTSLMIDLQQWLVALPRTSRDEIAALFSYLNETKCHLSWSTKQFLFDELAAIFLELARQSRASTRLVPNDSWDRLTVLLPALIDCITDEQSLGDYRLPYHPSVLTDGGERPVLLDLFFQYLKRSMDSDMINCDLLNKIMQATILPMKNRRRVDVAGLIYKQFRDYFVLKLTGELICQSDLSAAERGRMHRMLTANIEAYLSVGQDAAQLSHHLQIFLSTIISRRSWNFLLTFLKSDHITRAHTAWGTTLGRLLELKSTDQRSKYVHLCHQIQFTLSTDTTSSIFPALHQEYSELKKVVDLCVAGPDEAQRWTQLSAWIDSKQNTNINLTQIKVLLLLHVYYDYYCTNRLATLRTLLTVIQDHLQPLPEETQVFRALLDPERYMIGYPQANDRGEQNFLNKLFALDCYDEDELSIRHTLVNLLAMILMGGKQSFLWTFAFQPAMLQNTFGKCLALRLLVIGFGDIISDFV